MIMKAVKRFDCVKTKEDIHLAMLRESKGMSAAEERKWIENTLARSESPAAVLWRRIACRNAVSRVAESGCVYSGKKQKKKSKE
jgi:hypothetical protein